MGDSTLRPSSDSTGSDSHASNEVFPPNRDITYTNYGRAAFETILSHRNLRGGTVVLPAFLCTESFAPIFDAYDLDPAFVDVDPQTYHADFEQASREVGDADVVLVVHTFGAPADAERWRRLADERDAVLIEDCARALGASVGNRPVGGVGDYAIYSLPKVSPVARGGVLAAPRGEAPFDLGSPTYDPKHAHLLLPNVLQDAARYGYHQFRRIRDQLDGESEKVATREQEIVRTGWSPVPRKLDPLNRFLFERHLGNEFDAQLRQNEAAANRVRRALADFDVAFQCVRGTGPYHALGMTVSYRDELVSRLCDADVPAETWWDSPLVTAFDEEDLSAYPNTKTLAERAFQLPLVRMDEEDVTKAIGIITETMADLPKARSR